MLPENNARDRILSPEELERMLFHLPPPHASMVVHFAYLTGMRAGEIFNLTRDKVDVANRVSRLEAKDTKTAEPRVVFLCDQAYDILKEVGNVRFLEHNRVFICKRKSPKRFGRRQAVIWPRRESAPLVLPKGKIAGPLTISS